MISITKLITLVLQYLKFLKNTLLIRYNNNPLKTTALVFRVSNWKQSSIQLLLDEYNCIFIPKYFNAKFLGFLRKFNSNFVIIAWGYDEKEDNLLNEFKSKYNFPFYRIEDGFIRSVDLGSKLALPYSICLDKKGMYFDSTNESDLESLLNHFDFNEHTNLSTRARLLIEQLKEYKLSKYNHVANIDIRKLYGKKISKRVLVIGQVEDDASIKMGSSIRYSNNDLVRIAVKENPHCQVFYKPHPDVLSGRRKNQSDPNEVRSIVNVIDTPISLVDALETVDHVYTITSLSGFEALIRGIKVTTLGAPFYSNWGLTDDRQVITRRKRKLTIEQVFICAYLLYPKYADPVTKEKLKLEDVIERIRETRA